MVGADHLGIVDIRGIPGSHHQTGDSGRPFRPQDRAQIAWILKGFKIIRQAGAGGSPDRDGGFRTSSFAAAALQPVMLLFH